MKVVRYSVRMYPIRRRGAPKGLYPNRRYTLEGTIIRHTIKGSLMSYNPIRNAYSIVRYTL